MAQKFERPTVSAVGIWEDRVTLRIAEGPISLAGRPASWQVVVTTCPPGPSRTIVVDRSAPSMDVEVADLLPHAQIRASIRGVGVSTGGKTLISDPAVVDLALLPRLHVAQPYLYHDHASVHFSFPGWPCPAEARVASAFELRFGRTRSGPWAHAALNVASGGDASPAHHQRYIAAASCSHLSGFARVTFDGDSNPLAQLYAFANTRNTAAGVSTIVSRRYYVQVRCYSSSFACWSSWSDLQDIYLQPQIAARAASVMTSTMELQFGYSLQLTQPKVLTEDGASSASSSTTTAEAAAEVDTAMGDDGDDFLLPVSDIEVLTWPAVREVYPSKADEEAAMTFAKSHFKSHKVACSAQDPIKPLTAVTIHSLLPGTMYNLKLRWRYLVGSGAGSGWHQRLIRFATRALPRLTRIPQVSTTGFEAAWKGGLCEMDVQRDDLSLYTAVDPSASSGAEDRPALEEYMANYSYVLPSDLLAYPNPSHFILTVSAGPSTGGPRCIAVPFDRSLLEHLCSVEGLSPAIAYSVSVRFVLKKVHELSSSSKSFDDHHHVTALHRSPSSKKKSSSVDGDGRIVVETESDESDTVVVTTCAAIHLAVEQRGTAALWISYQAPKPPPVFVVAAFSDRKQLSASSLPTSLGCLRSLGAVANTEPPPCLLVPAGEYFAAGGTLETNNPTKHMVRIVEPVTVVIGIEKIAEPDASKCSSPGWSFPDDGDETWGMDMTHDTTSPASPLLSSTVAFSGAPAALAKSTSGSTVGTPLLRARSPDGDGRAGKWLKSPSCPASTADAPPSFGWLSGAEVVSNGAESPKSTLDELNPGAAVFVSMPSSPQRSDSASAQKKVFAFESFGVASFTNLTPDTTYRVSVNSKDSQGRWSGRHSIVSSTLDGATVLVDSFLKKKASQQVTTTTADAPTPEINAEFHMTQQALPLVKGSSTSLAAQPIEYDVVIVGRRAKELEVRATTRPGAATNISLNARIESLGFSDAVIEWEGISAHDGNETAGVVSEAERRLQTADYQEGLRRFNDQVTIREYRMHIGWEYIVDPSNNNNNNNNNNNSTGGPASPSRGGSPPGGKRGGWAIAPSAVSAGGLIADDHHGPLSPSGSASFAGSPLARRASLRRRNSFTLSDVVGGRRRATSVIAASETLTAERRFKDIYFRAATRRTRIDNLDRDKVYTVTISVFDPLMNRWSRFSKPLVVTTAAIMKLRMMSVVPTGIFLEWRKDETASEQLLLRHTKSLAPTIVQDYEVTATRVSRGQRATPALSASPSAAMDSGLAEAVSISACWGDLAASMTFDEPLSQVISKELVKPPATTYAFHSVETGVVSLTVRPTYAYGSRGPESPPLLVRIVPVLLEVVSLHERSILLRIASLPVTACERSKARQGRVMLSLTELHPDLGSGADTQHVLRNQPTAAQQQPTQLSRNRYHDRAGTPSTTRYAEVSLDSEYFEFKSLPPGTMFAASAFAATELIECQCCPEPPVSRGPKGNIPSVTCSTLLNITPVILHVGESTVEVEFHRNCRESTAEKYTITVWDVRYQQRLDSFATPARSLETASMTKIVRGLMPGCAYELSVRPATEPPETFSDRHATCVPFTTAGPLSIALDASTLRVYRNVESTAAPAGSAAGGDHPRLSDALLAAPVQLRIEQQPKVPPRVGLAGLRGISSSCARTTTTSPGENSDAVTLFSGHYAFPSLTAAGRQVLLPDTIPTGSTIVVWARQRTEDKLWGAWEKTTFKL
jgi:hypothetical protein